MTKDKSTKRASASGSSHAQKGISKGGRKTARKGTAANLGDPSRMRREILTQVAGNSDRPEHVAMRLVEQVLNAPTKDDTAEAMLQLLLIFSEVNESDRNAMIIFASTITMLHHSDWMYFYKKLDEGLHKTRASKNLTSPARQSTGEKA